MNSEDQPGSSDSLLMVFVILLIAGLVGTGLFFARNRTSRVTAASGACINNLRQIDGATEQWALETKQTNGSPVKSSDVLPYMRGGLFPTCPNLGVYTVSRVGAVPRCSVGGAGHTL